MGVWGAGNFQDDQALDYLWSEVQQPLIRRIEKMFTIPESASPDEPDGAQIMAAVEILAVLCENLNAAPPKPEDVEKWHGTYLQIWDGSIDRLDPKPEYKQK